MPRFLPEPLMRPKDAKSAGNEGCHTSRARIFHFKVTLNSEFICFSTYEYKSMHRIGKI